MFQPEADALAKRLQKALDLAIISRFQRPETIAHNDPVDGLASLRNPAIVLLPNELAVLARSPDFAFPAIDSRQDVDIEQTIVQRRYQGVSALTPKAGQMAVVAWRVDHQIGAVGQLGQCSSEFGILGLLGPIPIVGTSGSYAPVPGHIEVLAALACQGHSIGEITRQRPLGSVEIDATHAFTELEESHHKMHSRG